MSPPQGVSPALLEALGLDVSISAPSPTFPQLLEKLWTMKFQGMVTLHFAGGVPRSVVLAQPVNVPLDTRLDTRRDSGG